MPRHPREVSAGDCLGRRFAAAVSVWLVVVEQSRHDRQEALARAQRDTAT